MKIEETFYKNGLLKSTIITSEGEEVSKEDDEIIHGYLAWKYDLVDKLPDNHPYKKQAPIKKEKE